MLKLSPPACDSARCTPNLLPCRIHHDGPVNASLRYWAPEIAEDETQGAYFRGRKLKGKEVKVPEGYKGVIVKDAGNEQNAQSAMKTNQEGDLHDEDGDDEEEVKTIDEMGSFEEVVIWGHDSIADGDDAFVKGIGEWISFAEAMHTPGLRNEQ